MPAAAKKVGVWVAVAGLLCAGMAMAQSAPPARDIHLVLTRDVEPRIAYRGIPLQDHPDGASVTVFPGEALAQALERPLQALTVHSLADGELSDVAAGGPLRATLIVPSTATGSWVNTAIAPLGGTPLATGAAIGGSVMTATRGLGSLVSGAMAPLRQGRSP